MSITRITSDRSSPAVAFWVIAALDRGPISTDSVEKVAPFAGLRQNIFIGRRGITQHDGTVIEWTGAIVLLVQP